MENVNMTALVSAFARVYHAKNSNNPLFQDSVNLLTDEEYEAISLNMAKGIAFFNPSFTGSEEEALEWVVNHQLAPSPLGRAAFAEESLETAVRIGARNYVILGAGMDTFFLRQPEWARNVSIFELDHPQMHQFKMNRLVQMDMEIPKNTVLLPCDFNETKLEDVLNANNGYFKEQISFYTLLGVTYYLSPTVFENLLFQIGALMCKGSSLVFDYPDEYTFTDKASERVQKQVAMANFSGNPMLTAYSYEQMEQLLERCGFAIYEHLQPTEITNNYFSKHGDTISAFENVNYLLAVKQ
ncbi:MAG: class I SAM-dependent methyltransferase [Bacillaceae bacterium]